MKIDINKIRTTPEGMDFGFCVFGEPSSEIKEWSSSHGFKLEASGKYTNIIFPKNFDFKDCFIEPQQFEFLDGFSPNLNKHLHLGHLSNLVLAKAFQAMEVGKKYIAILGDTLTGEVTKEEALIAYEKYCADFKYKVDKIFMASAMKCEVELTCEGTGEYTDKDGNIKSAIGTRVFDMGAGNKIIGIKSNGSTSYFYQDVALCQKLNASTLYLTGSEQSGHFKSLKVLFPFIKHIPLGLVTINGEKLSSRKGNVIFLNQVLDLMNEKFNNTNLSYNVLAGQILKSAPNVNKEINTDTVANVKTSGGLYISYTEARLKSADVYFNENVDFNSNELQFQYIKAKSNLAPHLFFQAIVKHCEKINNLYVTNIIRDNEANKAMFSNLLEDLELGIKRLGLFSVEKV